MPCLEKIKSFAFLKNWTIFLFIVELQEYIFWILDTYQIYDLQIFSLVV